MEYSNPSIYDVLINAVSVYVVKFLVPSNFNMRCHSIYFAFFWNQLRWNRGITVNSYNISKFLVKNILLCCVNNMKFHLRRRFFENQLWRKSRDYCISFIIRTETMLAIRSFNLIKLIRISYPYSYCISKLLPLNWIIPVACLLLLCSVVEMSLLFYCNCRQSLYVRMYILPVLVIKWFSDSFVNSMPQ